MNSSSDETSPGMLIPPRKDSSRGVEENEWYSIDRGWKGIVVAELRTKAPRGEEQIPRVWIRANDWQRFRSAAGHGVPRDAASWVGRRKIYPHTAIHGHPHPRARSPQAARRISGATPASSSSFRFQTTWCPLWEKSSLSGLVPRRKGGKTEREREPDITTSMNIWERSLLLAWLDWD